MSSDPATVETIYSAMAWTMNSITLLIGFAFLWSAYRSKVKTYAIYLTMILNIADLVFPSVNVLTILFFDNSPTLYFILTGVTFFIYQFTIFWTAALAIYTYLILHRKESMNLKVFAAKAAIYCTLCNIIFPIMIWCGVLGMKVTRRAPGVYSLLYSTESVAYQIIYYIIFEIYGLFMPIGVTTFCYVRVYQVLKGEYYMPFVQSQSETRKILLFAFIPVICFLPEFFVASYCLVASVHFSMVEVVILSVLHRSWNFINLLAYWFLRPSKQNGDLPSEENSEDRSISLPAVRQKEQLVV